MNRLGENVKRLRREQKLTQVELAGSEMTSSMLSQIENGVSYPSMKTLQYLANRLGKPVSYFLDERAGISDVKSDLTAKASEDDEAPALLRINELIEHQSWDQAAAELDAMLSSGSGGLHSKMAADIAVKLGQRLAQTGKMAEGERYLKHAVGFYTAAGLHTDAAKSLLDIGRLYFAALRYQECETILGSIFYEYKKAILKDIRFEVELYYSKIMLYSAMGKMDELPGILEKALKLSSDTGFYYRTDELYRLRAVFSYLSSDRDMFEESIDQAVKFAEFNRNKTSLANIHLTIALEAADRGDMQKASVHTDLSKEYLGRSLYLHYILEARVHIAQEDYQKAFEAIRLVGDPGNIQFKLDFLIYWSHKTYAGLILHRLGRSGEGILETELGIERMEACGNSVYLADAWRALGEIYSDNKSFEKAYSALKTADAIGNGLKNTKIAYL